MKKTFLIAIMMVFAAGLILFGNSVQTLAESSIEARLTALENQNATLQNQNKDFQKRLMTLEDIEAIQKLERAYGFFLEHLMVDEIADCWAKDGSLEWLGTGRFVGQDTIRKLWHAVKANLAKRGQIIHPGPRYHGYITINPDGKTAAGRWYVGGTRNAMEFLCENRYVKEDGVWKYKVMQVGAFPMNTMRPGASSGGAPGGEMAAQGGAPSGGAPGGTPGGGPGGAPGGGYRESVEEHISSYQFTERFPTCPRQEDENYLRPFSFKHPVTGKDVNGTVEAWNKAHPCKE